jgi:hypothetical protein
MCVNKKTGAVRIISKNCAKSERTVYVNQQGVQGAAGAQGVAGPKGDTGIPGAKGDTGTPGLKGDVGAVGPAGPAGPSAAHVLDATGKDLGVLVESGVDSVHNIEAHYTVLHNNTLWDLPLWTIHANLASPSTGRARTHQIWDSFAKVSNHIFVFQDSSCTIPKGWAFSGVAPALLPQYAMPWVNGDTDERYVQLTSTLGADLGDSVNPLAHYYAKLGAAGDGGFACSSYASLQAKRGGNPSVNFKYFPVGEVFPPTYTYPLVISVG